MPTSPKNITLAILAGGEGSRMGQPKSLLRINGRPILQLLLQQFNWPGPTLLITSPGKENPPGVDLFTNQAVDPVALQGPLRGIHTALQNSTTEITIITTVDMPGIGTDQLVWIIDTLDVHRGISGVLLSRKIDSAIQIEPFPCAFDKSSLPLIENRLARNERSVQRLANDLSVSAIPAPDQWPKNVWTNLNSPEDLLRWSSDRDGE